MEVLTLAVLLGVSLILSGALKIKLKKIRKEKETVLEKADNIISKMELLTEKYIIIDAYDQDDTEYLAAIKEISQDKRFKFFLFDIEQQAIALLKEVDKEKFAEIQGLLRGLEHIRQELTKRVIKYNQKVSDEV